MRKLCLLLLLVAACRPGNSFRVRVTAPDGSPLSDARLDVGDIDQVYTGTTGDDGFLSVPNWADGMTARVSRTNFRSIRTDLSHDARIILSHMPESLRLIGAVEGRPVLFARETLVTVSDGGQYRLYAYTDTRVDEVVSRRLAQTVGYEFMRGDTLWFNTYDSGLYAYSLSDRLHPAQLMHLDIGRKIGPFAVTDTLIVTAEWFVFGPIRIYSYHTDGHTFLVSSFDSLWTSQVAVKSHYVVALSGQQNVLTVYDIADIRNPREAYVGMAPDYWPGFIYGNLLVMNGHDTIPDPDRPCFRLADLADPASPVLSGPFPTDSRVTGIVDDSTAVGDYDPSGASILRGNIKEGFHGVAIAATGNQVSGACPPYYLLGGNLWKLVNPGQD